MTEENQRNKKLKKTNSKEQKKTYLPQYKYEIQWAQKTNKLTSE
jgi:hypothetical protein